MLEIKRRRENTVWRRGAVKMAYEISISEKITLTIQEAAKLKDKYTHIERD